MLWLSFIALGTSLRLVLNAACAVSGLGVSALPPIGGRLLGGGACDRDDARPCGKSQPSKCEL